MGKKDKHSVPKKQKAAQRGGKAEEEGGAASERSKKDRKQQRRRSGREHHWDGADDLERELAPLGLRVKTIEADGNCFFRSVCDQLEGDGGDHLGLRRRVMEFIEEREEEYSFFIEDDEPFAKYIKRMKKEGAWAGHLELQATSILLQHNISVYQAGQPVWHIRNFGEEAPTLHLSYHEGMHYNSVRNRDDYGSGPPELLRVGGSAADLAAADVSAVAAAARAFGAREVDQVVAGTGCADREHISRVLQQCGGSVDQAIELLIKQLGQEEEEEVGEGGEEAAVGAAAAGVAAAATASAGTAEQGQEHESQGQADGPAPLPGGEEQQQQEQQQDPGSRQQAAAEAPGAQQQLERCGDEAVRLELALDPDNPDGRVRVALLPAVVQQQQEQQQSGEQQQEQQQAAEASAGGRQHAGGSKAERVGKKAGVRVKGKGAHLAGHIGRNQRCPCGSTRKFKNCCGALRGERGAAAVGRGVGAAEGSGSEAGAVAGAAQQLQVLYI